MTSINEREAPWLAAFFSGKNALHWDQIRAGTAPRQWLSKVTPWLGFLQGSELEHPLVLPMFDTTGAGQWFAVAHDDRVAAQLLEEFGALIGPSFGHFPGQWYVPVDPEGPELALQQRFGHRVLKVDVPDGPDRAHVERIIAQYQELLQRRPPVPDRTTRPFGLIRKEFDLALLAGNAQHAQKYRDELVASGRLGADQQKFLEIRLLAGLGRIEEIARDRLLIESVMHLSLPPQTLVDVVEALYATYIEPEEAGRELGDLLPQFSKHVARPFGPLFGELKGIGRAQVLRAFFLYEASKDARDDERCRSFVESYPRDDAKFGLIQSWARALPPAPSSDSRERARQAIADEDYESAVPIAFEGLPQPWAYAALLRSVFEIESAELRGRIRSSVSQMDAATVAALTDRDRARRERLLQSTATATKSRADASWLDWASAVTSGTEGWEPIDALSEAVLKWDVSAYARDSKGSAKLADLIGNADGPAADLFREAFPKLVEFFAESPQGPNRNFVPIYSMLIGVLVWSSPVSGDELEICASLTSAILETGPDEQTYTECIQNLSELWKENSSLVHLDWALGVAELLALHPSQAAEKRLNFFFQVFETCRSSAHRLSATQLAVLALLASDYDCPDLLNDSRFARDAAQAGTPATFSGLIGIYTLNEPAGQRARTIVESMLPSAKVELNSDTTATDRLRHLAQNADLFVFAWRVSSHQAFYCAKDSRKGRDLIMPPGKGTSSIVTSILANLPP